MAYKDFRKNGFVLAHRHEITIDEFNLNVEAKKGPQEKPQAIEFVEDKSGKFTIYCKTCESGSASKHH